MFRVGSREKAQRQLRRAEQLLGSELRVNGCERYWKIPELWTCNAATEFDAASVSDQTTRCLLLANRLANSWQVRGPHLRPDGTLEGFSGIFSRGAAGANMQSLEWAQFQVTDTVRPAERLN